jgi:hypothetical protein
MKKLIEFLDFIYETKAGTFIFTFTISALLNLIVTLSLLPGSFFLLCLGSAVSCAYVVVNNDKISRWY